LIFTGTAEANSIVEVYINGILSGTTPVNASGSWLYDYRGVTLSDGNYDLVVK
jgi:hypothetical protein